MKNKLILIVLGFFVLAGGVLWWGHTHPRHNGQATRQTAKPAQSHPLEKAMMPSFDKHKYSIDAAGSPWWIVNKTRPLSPLKYAPADLVTIGNGQLIRSQAAAAFRAMTQAAKTAGFSLLAESGYRSYATQVSVYNSEVRRFGKAKADTESARPGYSEHQTGWAVDIELSGCSEDCFSKTPAANWLATHAYDYGFILRYPQGKENVTGYRNEPWHYRYVGKELAGELHGTGQTMEEFFGLPAVGAP